MPEVVRTPFRMDCAGVDLVHPVDRMPPGYYPYLSNVRVVDEGRIESRPGYTPFGTLAGANFHSIRRLNDPDLDEAPTGYIYVLGSGNALVTGTESALTQVDTGYSGKPLSLLTFRPDNSPESWMYVYDALRQRKVRADGGTVRPVGVDPPGPPVNAEYGVPGSFDLHTGQTALGWTQSGAAAAPTAQNRLTTACTISTILYNVGTSGWCVLSPSTSMLAWAGERMKVILGGTENCIVREIHPAIAATTLAGISYDSGSSGPCSLVLTGSPDGLDRNSIIVVGGEATRVLAVTMAPDGSLYSVRCVLGSHAAGAVVTGLVSWYVYTGNTHAPGASITSGYVLSNVASIASTNLAAIAVFTTLDASHADNTRPFSLADDYLHASFFASNPYGIVELKLYVDISPATTGLANAFQQDYLTWNIDPTAINSYNQTTAPVGGCWTELVLPLSQGQRTGTDQTASLATVHALKVEVTLSAPCNFGFDWWYLFGTYGPTILPNDPVGYVYATRNRDTETGAASVPGPPTRYQLFPLREVVDVTPASYTGTGFVDALDIYRQGGALAALTFVGSIPGPTPVLPFVDEQPEESLLANPQADFTLIQPWPVTDIGWAGTCNVIGTTLVSTSGTPFDLNLLSNQVILVNGIAYQTYGQPSSSSRLELFKAAQGSGGVLTNVPFEVQSPTLAAQPLPFVFGPLEGPFAPVAFGLGDDRSPGTLYYTNVGNLDAAPDTNTLEICAPGEPLISGAVWNGLVIVGSRDNIYLVRYSFLNSVGQSGPATFQFQRLPSPSGMWSRWTCARAQDGVYFLGRDGFYRATEAGVERVASPDPKSDPLYPLFPHDGQPAKGTPEMQPIDMTLIDSMRLTCCDQDLYFNYSPVGG